MTDKIFPDWINDRLPTKEDEDGLGFVGSWNGDYVKYLPSYMIEKSTPWFNSKRLDESNNIATPQECLDREQGEVEEYTGESDTRTLEEKRKAAKQGSVEERMVMVEADFMQKEIKDLERIAKTINKRNDELEEVNHGLEQALSTSQAVVSDFGRALTERGEQVEKLKTACDCFSSKAGLRQELLYYKNQNKLLKNILRMEWGG